MKKIIFLYSLPRSGSTLLQRLIATSNSIKTVSEPWLLLPFYTMDKKDVSYSIYGSIAAANAILDLKLELENGELTYQEWRKNSILSLYSSFASENGYDYLLDKTPRYSLIVDEISCDFEDHVNIILWRNPLAIAASMIETWGGGSWNINKYDVDFFYGLPNLISTYKKHPDRFITFNYEMLVEDPSQCLASLSHVLTSVKSFDVDNINGINLKGRMGDPNFGKKFSKVSTQSVDTWKLVFCNPIRRYWARNLLKNIGEDDLKLIGYDMASLLSELSECGGNKNLIKDLFISTAWFFATRLELKVHINNFKNKKYFFKR